MSLAGDAAFVVGAAVASALESGRPVVALESAVITQGLPRPLNLEVARAMESVLRQAGVEPATIAVLDGCVRIGLEDAELERLANTTEAGKCSLRDLPLALAGGQAGGTTVSASIFAAHRAGIGVFATGGIGGVHRGAPFDVSADLDELGRCPITVVCSGAKSLLDLAATLEVLETRGVTLVGWRCDHLPAFYVADSGLPLPDRVDDAKMVARLIRARDALGLAGALVVAVPVPARHALALAEVEALVTRADAEAKAEAIAGAALTPFMLAAIAAHSEGRSLAANRALLVNNARIAAEIAVALAAAATTGSSTR